MAAPSVRTKAVAPKSAWTMFCEHHEHHQSSSSNSTHRPLHLANHPFFPLHLGVNALAGPAGSGKTQICLSLIADCVWRQQKAVYISIGQDATVHVSQRLHSMLKHRKIKAEELRASQQGSRPSHNPNIDQDIKQDYLTKIFVNWVRNPDDLMHMLYHGLPKLLQEHDTISFVVLDGIATLFRGKDGNGKTTKYYWADRSAQFFQIASQSQRLSFAHKVPILFTNQATSKLSNSGLLASQLEPALGLSWAQCINASYFVRRQSSTSNKRTLKCIKSSHMSTKATAEFAIEQRGTVRTQKS